MTPNDFSFGFRVVGSCTEARRLVKAAAAFSAHACCDERAELNRESYLSAFQFGDAFRSHLERHDSPKGYAGPCWSPWLWQDIDRPELDRATHDARRLAAFLVDRFGLDADDLLLFFSGSKGFHVGMPLAICGELAPALDFHDRCRRLGERLARESGVAIDSAVFDRVRLFRSPNSRHPKTGRHKRRLSFDELLHLRTERIVELAAEPQMFDVPDPPRPHPAAIRAWGDSGEELIQRAASLAVRKREPNAAGRLNRATLAFIREGAAAGDRARLLFSAAANLAEQGCPPALVHELLTESALDSGLSPSEAKRQIECGCQSQNRGNA